MNEFLYSLDFDVLCHLIHSFMPRYAVPVRQYRPLQSRLLQCIPHGKPPCDLLMLPDVIGRIRDSPPESFHSGRSPSGSFFFERTIFAIQGTHCGQKVMAGAAASLKVRISLLGLCKNEGSEQ